MQRRFDVRKESIHECLQTAAHAHQLRLRTVVRRAQQAAVPALHLDELRQRRLHAQTLRIAGIDSADERLGQAIEYFASETSCDE